MNNLKKAVHLGTERISEYFSQYISFFKFSFFLQIAQRLFSLAIHYFHQDLCFPQSVIKVNYDYMKIIVSIIIFVKRM